MSNIDITLPERLKAFLDEQVTQRGFKDASEFVESLLEAERNRQLREEVESLLLKRVDGPFTDLTADDFNAIRREGRRIIAARTAK